MKETLAEKCGKSHLNVRGRPRLLPISVKPRKNLLLLGREHICPKIFPSLFFHPCLQIRVSNIFFSFVLFFWQAHARKNLRGKFDLLWNNASFPDKTNMAFSKKMSGWLFDPMCKAQWFPLFFAGIKILSLFAKALFLLLRPMNGENWPRSWFFSPFCIREKMRGGGPPLFFANVPKREEGKSREPDNMGEARFWSSIFVGKLQVDFCLIGRNPGEFCLLYFTIDCIWTTLFAISRRLMQKRRRPLHRSSSPPRLLLLPLPPALRDCMVWMEQEEKREGNFGGLPPPPQVWIHT